MNEHHYQRIDKGIERLKPSDLEREARQQARDAAGKFLPLPLELRTQVVQDALEALERGLTAQDLAQKHQVPLSTVYSWLIADSRAVQARAFFFSDRLANHLKEIETAEDPLGLARAREAYRAWSDIAAKRDPANYGVKQEVTHQLGQTFTDALLEISKRRPLRNRDIMSNGESNIINDIQDAELLPSTAPAKDSQTTES